ncbi:hypothetical protein Esti_004802 [Eimeria stiedai]
MDKQTKQQLQLLLPYRLTPAAGAIYLTTGKISGSESQTVCCLMAALLRQRRPPPEAALPWGLSAKRTLKQRRYSRFLGAPAGPPPISHDLQRESLEGPLNEWHQRRLMRRPKEPRGAPSTAEVERHCVLQQQHEQQQQQRTKQQHEQQQQEQRTAQHQSLEVKSTAANRYRKTGDRKETLARTGERGYTIECHSGNHVAQ